MGGFHVDDAGMVHAPDWINAPISASVYPAS
jgi:hypothetical protein